MPMGLWCSTSSRLWILALFWFLFLLLHTNGVVVFHLFPAADISVTASSVTAAVVLGAAILRVETKMAPTTKTMVTMNEMHHGMPSTLPSNPCLREGKGEGDEGKGGSRHCGRRWQRCHCGHCHQPLPPSMLPTLALSAQTPRCCH